MKTSSRVAWCVARCIGSLTAFREGREQRRNGPMHFPDGEPPMHSVMRQTLDTGQRAQDAMQTCAVRLFADRELDDVLGAERGNQLARRSERDHLSVVDHRDAIAEPGRFFHVVRGQQNGAPARLESFDDVPGLMARLRIQRPVVGSSRKSTSGSPTNAQARDSRCFCPPDSVLTCAAAFSSSPTSASTSATSRPRG